MKRPQNRTRCSADSPRRVSETALLAAFLAAALLAPLRARAADYQVYSPNVVLGESEIEARAFTSWGTSPATGVQKGLKLSFAHSFTDRWATELYAEGEQEYGETLKLEGFEWENRFQFTPQGEYWATIGLLNENEIPRSRNDPYEIKFGPIFEKDFLRWTALLNLLATHQYGTNAEPGIGLVYRVQLEYRWRRQFSPVVEAYGEPVGRIGNFGNPRHQIGPGVTGQIPFGPGRSLRYGVVALFGASHAAAAGTLVLRLEYEFY